MINRYPLWKYLLLLVTMVLGVIYAMPNLYGEDPAVQVTTSSGDVPGQAAQTRILDLLQKQHIPIKSSQVEHKHFLVRFKNEEAQLKAVDILQSKLGADYTVAVNLAQTTPKWLRDLHARPMYLGLDLRGGVHFLMQVDVNAAIKQQVDRYVNEFRNLLRDKRIRYSGVEGNKQTVSLSFQRAPERERAYQVLSDQYRELKFTQQEKDGKFWLTASLRPAAQQKLKDQALEQNITTLRNRVNELGVAEPVIQRQGRDRIVVELPGIQDTTRAKEIIGATATLQFRMVDDANATYNGSATGPVPPGAERFQRKGGGYVLLKRRVILTGDYITNASSGIDQQTGGPEVDIRLNSVGGTMFHNATRNNVGKQLAVVFIETKTQTVKEPDGTTKRIHHKDEKVINIATIQEPLGSSFRITGLSSSRAARNLALLLRAGSLAAPMDIVEERTIGPSLGHQNIVQGFYASVIGFLVVAGFMWLYYGLSGLIADLALFANLVLVVALLSMIQATLTLPGIAGIVLTIGMAVDANVLIFERIREELRNGVTPQAAINAGYEKAFGTIADSNITTLIAGIVLFAFGTGPVKGFAVTLSLGIATSMYTAIVGTRAVTNLIYGRRKKLKRVSV